MPDSSKKIFGIDLSHHNGSVDFNKVKAAGVKFVILRCGYASQSNRNKYGKDKKFEEYYSAAKSAGLAIGTYFYSMCNSKETGKAEAEFILKTIAGKTFEYPVWLDVEEKANITSTTPENMTAAIETCLDTIKAAGYKVGILDADITGPSIPKAFGIHEQALGNETELYPCKSLRVPCANRYVPKTNW